MEQLDGLGGRVNVEALHAAVEEHHFDAVVVKAGADADELLSDTCSQNVVCDV